MSERRFGAGGVPLRPIVEDTPEEPEVVEEAPKNCKEVKAGVATLYI